jgi:hypothetical protein
LVEFLDETNPSIINPVGFIAQEFIEKWFYDLRIILAKERGKTPYCYPKALARAGFKDFRTNTYLGNMVFGVDLPPEVKDVAFKCGKAVGQEAEAWLREATARTSWREGRRVRAVALHELGSLCLYRGLFGQARSLYRKALCCAGWVCQYIEMRRQATSLGWPQLLTGSIGSTMP